MEDYAIEMDSDVIGQDFDDIDLYGEIMEGDDTSECNILFE